MRRIWVVALLAACAHAKSGGASAPKVTLVLLPTESDSHPGIATAATDAITRESAKVAGVSETVASKVSIEVVQLSIECVDATATCYGTAAKSLAADKLLFAQVDDERGRPRVTVTLYDVASSVPRASHRTFDSDAAAVAGVGALVAEATR